MPFLVSTPKNATVTIRRIFAGRHAREYLADLGVLEGEHVKVIKNDFGPIIIEVKNTRIALGRGLASKIEVGDVSTNELP